MQQQSCRHFGRIQQHADSETFGLLKLTIVTHLASKNPTVYVSEQSWALKSWLKVGQIDFAKPSRHTSTRETNHNFWSRWRKHTSSPCSVCLFFRRVFGNFHVSSPYTEHESVVFLVRTLACGQRLSEKQKKIAA